MKNSKKKNIGLKYDTVSLRCFFGVLDTKRYLRCIKKLSAVDFVMLLSCTPFLVLIIIGFIIAEVIGLITRKPFDEVVNPIGEKIVALAEIYQRVVRTLMLFLHFDRWLWTCYWNTDSEFEAFEKKNPERGRRIRLKTENFLKWFELQSYKMPITKDVFDWYMKHISHDFINEVKAKRKKRNKK